MASYLFIDSRVSDIETLVRSLDPDTSLVVLDANEDGLAQLAKALLGKTGLDAIHVISHATSGKLQLGNIILQARDLITHHDQLAKLGSALKANGDLLLYGCELAAGESGEVFLKELARLSGADVAASTNFTGAAAKGGDWNLESHIGAIESASPLDQSVTEAYDHILPTTVNFSLTGTALKEAINLSIAAYDSNNYSYNSNAPGWELLSKDQLGITDGAYFPTSDYLFSPDIPFSSADPQAFIAYNRDQNWLAISFRGTAQFGDFVTDVLGWSKENFETYYNRYSPLLTALENYLDEHTSIRKVLVTGHSLGGAVAELFMDRHENVYGGAFFTPYREYLGITFGSPGNSSISDPDDPRLFNFGHEGDPVVDAVSEANAGADIIVHRPDLPSIDTVPGLLAYALAHGGSIAEHGKANYKDSVDYLTSSRGWAQFQDNPGDYSLVTFDPLLGSGGSVTGSGNGLFMVGGFGLDTFSGGNFNDILDGKSGNDRLEGGNGNDHLFGGNADDILVGGEDNDYLEGGAGHDTIDGGSGFDWASYDNSGASIVADLTLGTASGEGNDTFAGIEGIIGSKSADRLTGSPANDHLKGNAGNDQLFGGGGDDTLYGGFGSDTLDGGSNGAAGDLAVFEFSRNKYSVTTIGGTTTVNLKAGGDSDSVTNVEYFQFGDGPKVHVSQVNDVTTYASPTVAPVPDLPPATPSPPPAAAGALPELYASDFSFSEGNAGTTNNALRVYLTSSASTNVTFNYVVLSKDAISWAKSGADFSFSGGSLTIPKGKTSVDISIPIIGDTKVEGDEAFWVLISGATGANLPGGQIVYTVNGKIVDDDTAAPKPPPPPPPPPAGPIYLRLAVDDTSLLEGASGATTAFEFDVVRTGDLSVSTKYRYEVEGYGANPATADDFSAGSFPTGTGSFAVGEDKETITVLVKGDAATEHNEAFRVRLFAESAGVKVIDSTEMATIRNDDGTTPPSSAGPVFVSIRPFDAIKAEGTASTGSTPFVFELTREGDLAQETQVGARVRTTGDTPQASTTDFTASSFTVTFAIGQDTAYVTFPGRRDAVNEPDEPFEVSLSTRSGYENVEFGDRTAIGTILNDDGPAPPLVTAPSLAVLEADTGQTVNLRVQLSAPTSSTVSMNYEVYAHASSDAPSVAGADFVAASGVVSISPGSTFANIPISALGDNLAEGIEVIDVRLSDLVNGYFGRSIGTWDTAVVILDDESGAVWPGNPSISPANYADLGAFSPYTSARADFWLDENTPHQLFRFEVEERMGMQLLGRSPSEIVFAADGTLIYTDLSQVDNIEINDISGSLADGMAFEPGIYYLLFGGQAAVDANTPYNVVMTGIPLLGEPPVLFGADLFTGGSIAPNQGVEGGSVAFGLQISHATERVITFDYEARSLSATGGLDFEFINLTGSITAGDTSSNVDFIGLPGDSVFEGNETFEIIIRNVVGAVLPNQASELAIPFTIVDDDPSPTPLFAITPIIADRAEGTGHTGKFTFEVSRPFGGADTPGSVDWIVSGSGLAEATASDFEGGTFPGGTMHFAAGETGKTLTINVNADTAAELDEGFRIELRNPSAGFGIFDNGATGTIRNDDGVFVVPYLGTHEVESAISYAMTESDVSFIGAGANPIDIAGNALANRIFGNNAANRISGGDGDDVLLGLDGNDTLDGGSGYDELIGGKGNDSYFVDSIYDVAHESDAGGFDKVFADSDYVLPPFVEELELIGFFNYSGSGNDLNNVIRGNSGENLLDGGMGNDTYFIDNANDQTIELASAGTDFVRSTVSWTLMAHTEELQLLGTSAINGIGNELNNWMQGNPAANILDGRAGNDSMMGLGGHDTYYVDSVNDKTIEAANTGTDFIRSSVSWTLMAHTEELQLLGSNPINGSGNELNNWIQGNSAANILNGKAGADAMIGLGGSDTYFVDHAGDKTVEGASAGTDFVRSTISWTLMAHTEELQLLGTSAINGSGNELNNWMQGNSAANVLDGKAGNDTLIGLGGNDTYMVDSVNDKTVETASAGTDFVRSAISWTLMAHTEELQLLGSSAINGSGNELNNWIQGNSAVNILDGKAGADAMIGLGGSDTYFVDHVGDKTIEGASAGTDFVRSTISWTLMANTEELQLLGTSPINGTGNELNNWIQGNSAANIIDGKAGNDAIITGGGADIVRFSTALGPTNIDRVSDFSVVDDTIQLATSIFTALGGAGALNADFFRSGVGITTAGDGNDYLIYNSSTGALYYDADGNAGVSNPQQFAVLTGNPALTAADFVVAVIA